MGKNKLIFLFTLIISSFILSGCESEDDEKLLSAQNCFNKLDDSLSGTGGAAAAAAQTCTDKLGGLSSPESQLLRCGLEFWVGGLNSSKIVTAFDAYEAAPDAQKEATLIDNLTLSSTAVADSAYSLCYSSGAPGMIYVSALVRLGTYMEAAPGAGANPDDLVDECLADTGSCANASNGQMLIDMADVYCVGDSAENDVCTALNTAIDANPGDPAATIATFLAQINY